MALRSSSGSERACYPLLRRPPARRRLRGARRGRPLPPRHSKDEDPLLVPVGSGGNSARRSCFPVSRDRHVRAARRIGNALKANPAGRDLFLGGNDTHLKAAGTRFGCIARGNALPRPEVATPFRAQSRWGTCRWASSGRWKLTAAPVTGRRFSQSPPPSGRAIRAPGA
jgi:hypothetical protein